MLRLNRRSLAIVLLSVIVFALCLAVRPGYAEPKVFVWAEAEEPASADFELPVNEGAASFLSGGKQLLKALNAGDAQTQVPAGGLNLSYKMAVPEDGLYEVWARVGYESARAPLRWRIDEGGWTDIGSDVLTTNVMALGVWWEIGWLHLGDAQLAKGPVTLQIHYPKVADGSRMLIGLDCLALTRGHFVPENYLKPGQTYTGDVDKEAAAQVFQLPEPAGAGARVALKLNGAWQVARYDDPDMMKDRFEPVKALPAPDDYPLRWMGVDVPGSLWNKPEMAFGHRLVYRTKINVPAAYRGRGFKLHFSGTNFIVSVFVNGKLAGAHKGVLVPWDMDISRLVEPGKVNELAIAVKSYYYALDSQHYRQDGDVNRIRHVPRNHSEKNVLWLAPIYPSTKGDGDGKAYGIVNPVTLVATGDVYTDDVFVKPSVQNKRLDIEVTVRNTDDAPRNVSVVCEAVNDRTGEVEKKFDPVQFTVPAGATAMKIVGGAWADPKLWWPVPEPDLYRLRTTVMANAVLDVQEELFGFREVTIKDTGVYINGVRRNFWNWVAVSGRPQDGETWLKAFHGAKDRFTRFSHNRKTRAFLPTREERLEFYDRNGIAGRLCSMIDGMFITHYFGDRGSDPATGARTLIPNDPLWENCREHLVQMAKAYRNHPSVIMYQAENEFLYITGTLRYRDVIDDAQKLFNDCIDAAREVDPTRPYTVGGGGALGGRLEINSPHYPAGSLDWYPENAYTLEKFSSRITDFGWAWKKDMPWMVGESAFASELRYGTYALGDRAYRGTDYMKLGKARYLRMLYGGYRWVGAAGFFPWDNLAQYEDSQKVFDPLYVIPRKQTSRLFGGRENRLLFKVMNDTLSREPVTFEWTYEVGGRKVAGEKLTLDIEPGFGQERTLVINAPATDERLDGVLTLTSSSPGADAPYVDARSVPALPAVKAIRVKEPIVVLDQSGKVAEFLRSAGAKFTSIGTLAESKGKDGVLVIGPDTLTPEEAFGNDILSFAGRGGAVIVLEQETPPAGRNLPAPLAATNHYYGYVHPQALGTPVFKDLGADDLMDWAGDHPTCKRVFAKPSQGARSLAECGNELKQSALVEMPCGRGVVVLCQLRVGAKLGTEPAADVLLRNMMETYAGFTPAAGVVAICAPGNRLLVDNVRATGVLSKIVDSVDAAIDPARHKVALIDATPGNLQALNRLKGRATAFQDAGGWIMLCGLGREGVDEFNELMGTNHMIRPFRLERVTLESPNYRLAATLGNRDVALISPTVIQHGRKWVSSHTFNAVIDGRNVAPFCEPPGAPADPWDYKPGRTDRDPYNLVNAVGVTDHWRYYYSYWIAEEGPQPLVFKLPRPELISQINFWSNQVYWSIEEMDVIFDGDEATKVTMTFPHTLDVQTVNLPEPRKVKRTIAFQVRSWRPMNPGRPDIRLVGIDNVEMLRPEPPGKVVFLDSLGGLVAYPRGEGGVFLNQVKWMQNEPNPDNIGNKRNLVGVILRNMGVGSGTGQVAMPGVNIRYRTTNLTNWCNSYMTEHDGKVGWFGGKGRDLRDFAVGERQFADVTYHVPDYSTAPVPNCIIIRQRGVTEVVKGIEIGAKADLLFFLYAADVRRPVTDQERQLMGARRNPFVLPEVARYVIHYADGEQAVVPLVLDKHVRHWEQDKPIALPGAAIATRIPIEVLEGKVGVLYSMQVTNPRPDVEIKSIDFDLARNSKGNVNSRAGLALLGITLGTMIGG